MFSFGSSVSLQEVLAGREWRLERQKQLLGLYRDMVLLDFKCNIPGPIKNNASIERLFQHGLEAIIQLLNGHKILILHQQVKNAKVGPEAFLVVDSTAEALKGLMIAFEESSPLARLYDSDVLYRDPHYLEPMSLSRQELGYPQRTCLICDRPAKECGRSRQHSVEEMQAAIERLCQAYLP
ncbi:citrate lyase holo-[acyl-carrier protein] synthase [Streptococcus pantholopis]|uniref:citrate lyase holo-[acyl-carrier protein] synthase n=1 Tax=Streptococcus pantholopis TaxID=1811193 RepID=A0A172Q860_9STRE|nr:citrate lyase holo-[acyl-carrier protein] synthase [Streptococcus pantholopis]AND79654.1 hypothetical protein A0O21_06270 [Streptococcus pantholopis]